MVFKKEKKQHFVAVIFSLTPLSQKQLATNLAFSNVWKLLSKCLQTFFVKLQVFATRLKMLIKQESTYETSTKYKNSNITKLYSLKLSHLI